MSNGIAQNLATNHRNEVKALNTLMGIVAGIVCDQRLDDSEIAFLSTWMKENREVATRYPANVIYRRVAEVLQDGVVTSDERNHLFKELQLLSGNDFANTGSALPEHIQSAFDDDPHVVFEGNVFVLTGTFLYGTRAHCSREIEKRGGIADDNITQRTNYLVVGSTASPDWIVQNFGRKIQKAAEMARSGDFDVAIIREVDWVMHL